MHTCVPAELSGLTTDDCDTYRQGPSHTPERQRARTLPYRTGHTEVGHPHATTLAKTCYADMHTRLLALTPARPHHLDRLPLLIPDVAGERALGGMLLLGFVGRLEGAPTLRGGMPEVTCT